MWPNGGLILIHHLYMHYRHYHGFCHFITFPLLSRSGNHNFKINFLFPLHFQVFLINMIIFTIISFLLSPIWGGSCIFYKSKWTNNPFLYNLKYFIITFIFTPKTNKIPQQKKQCHWNWQQIYFAPVLRYRFQHREHLVGDTEVKCFSAQSPFSAFLKPLHTRGGFKNTTYPRSILNPAPKITPSHLETMLIKKKKRKKKPLIAQHL